MVVTDGSVRSGGAVFADRVAIVPGAAHPVDVELAAADLPAVAISADVRREADMA
jgi:hypothetical protein